MLYFGREPVVFMGDKTIDSDKMKNEWSGGLYVKDACLVTNYNTITTPYRDDNMDRVYDWLNYSDIPYGETPPAGGFEVEATFIPFREDSWVTVWGTRVGTSGKVTRANIIVGSSHKISQGLSYLPATNAEYGESILGRKVTVRLICVPTTSPDYAHAYSGRLIVTDANTGELLSDNTDIWGDNWEYGKNAMFSNATTFYRFHSAWFSRNRYANPVQNSSTGQDFEGIFFGGAVYINPTGADATIAKRIPVQYLQPAKNGKDVVSKFNRDIQYPVYETGVFYETVNIGYAIAGREIVSAYRGMMYNCPNYTNAKLVYFD